MSDNATTMTKQQATSVEKSSNFSNGTMADELVPTAMSTSALETKLKELRERSNKHSQLLTAKLASSQSGQNLLHIGTSLSTLPPDLHSLLTQLHPVLSSAETTEKVHHEHLSKLVQCGNAIRHEQRKVVYAQDAADLYEDLVAAEQVVEIDVTSRDRRKQKPTGATKSSSAASTGSSNRRQYSFDSASASHTNDDDMHDGDDDQSHHHQQQKDKSTLKTTAGT
jgi:hypothetical protein